MAVAVAGDPFPLNRSRPSRAAFFDGPSALRDQQPSKAVTSRYSDNSSTSPRVPGPIPPTLVGDSELITMQTDYTAAIVGVTVLVAVLTAMTVFVLSRPSDLAPRSPR